MKIARRAAVALLTTVASAAVMGAGATGAFAHESPSILKAPLEASVPTDPLIDGVAPGPERWVLASGSVELRADGRLEVKLKRLVLPSRKHTVGPVKSIDASLYCAQESTAAATTEMVPMPKDGKAEINTTIAVPELCLTPVVLVHPLGIESLYIAVTD